MTKPGDEVVAYGWVCAVVDYCTCAGGGEWPHEPGCGLEPLYQVDDPAADGMMESREGG